MAGGTDEARLRAEAKFKKKEEADREAKKIWEERAAAGRAQDEKRAKLKSLRLAKEAADQDARAQPAAKAAKKPSRRKPSPAASKGKNSGT